MPSHLEPVQRSSQWWPRGCQPGGGVRSIRRVIPPLSTPTTLHSLAFSRERDARICWLLDRHPVTSAMLVQLGWFPTRAKAQKRLRRLVGKNAIRLVGTVCRRSGRPEHVYCRWRAKPDQLLHEVELTALSLRIDAAKILRGPHGTANDLRPDAELWINGQRYFLELDRGTEGYAQITRRFHAYEGCNDFVLWICPTAERREGLRRRAEKLRHIALFTTFTDALSSPHDAVWIDYQGGHAALPREGAGNVA